MAGAFMALSGATLAGIFNIAALRRERPSEIVVLYRLTRIAVVSVLAGMTVALGFGLWLVADLDFVKWSDAWVITAVILWLVANALGGNGGRRDRRARGLAGGLAGAGGHPRPRLRFSPRGPVTPAMSWGNGAGVIVILVLMIWKPGH